MATSPADVRAAGIHRSPKPCSFHNLRAMNRKFFLGCGCLILIVIGTIAIGMFVAAPRAWQKGKTWFNAQLKEASRRSAVESAWQPPSARPDASWFPAVVDNWTLSISEDIATVPDLQLDRPGRRGKYRGEKQDIEVTVVPVSAEELNGTLDRAQSALVASGKHVIEKSGNPSFKIETSSSHLTTRTPGRLYVRLQGDEHTRLWWIKDWLFIFRTTGPEDPDAFADRFIESMSPTELEKR